MWRPLILASLFLLAFGAVSGDIVNTSVDRRIDLTTQFARHNISISFKNTGNKGTSTYEVVLPTAQAEHLAYITANTRGGASLPVTKNANGSKKGYESYTVTFPKEFAPDSAASFSVYFVLTHTLSPFPTHITQAQRQYVRYNDNHYFASPYPTTTQTTVFKLASSSVESHAEKKPFTLRGDTLTYGPYSNTDAFATSATTLHFENNAPFITFTSVKKDLEVSHWGNLAVEQAIHLQHDGAILKGSWSRFDFQRNQGASPSAVLLLTELLPLQAADVYYRDDIGNISTSTFAVSSKGLEFKITPRFPLFGGWKNNFYTGYNLPLNTALSTSASDSSLYTLNTTFAPAIAGATTDHFTLRIVLPEGAKDIQVRAPFPLDKQGQDWHFTYLDTSGRPVIVIEKSNVVEEHVQYFQVEYRYSKISMLHEPLLLTGAVLAFCVLFMVYSRLNLGIATPATVVVHPKSS